MFPPWRLTYASFHTHRELSIVMVETETGASADDGLQEVEPRDQGNSCRDQQTLTVLDGQPRLARETCSGWNHGCKRAELAGGEPGGSTLRVRAARRLRRLQTPAGGAAAPRFRPRRGSLLERNSRASVHGGGGDAGGGRERILPLGKEPESSLILKRPQ